MTQAIAEDLARVPMSPSLAATLTRAADYARQQGHARVTLEHMLMALTEDPDATLVLKASAVAVERVTADITTHLAASEPIIDAAGAGALGLAPELKRVLEAAAVAAQQGRRQVTGAIVLAAIVGEGKSTAAEVLRAQGMTFDAAIKALQRSTQPGAAPSGPRAVLPPTPPAARPVAAPPAGTAPANVPQPTPPPAAAAPAPAPDAQAAVPQPMATPAPALPTARPAPAEAAPAYQPASPSPASQRPQPPALPPRLPDPPKPAARPEPPPQVAMAPVPTAPEPAATGLRPVPSESMAAAPPAPPPQPPVVPPRAHAEPDLSPLRYAPPPSAPPATPAFGAPPAQASAPIRPSAPPPPRPRPPVEEPDYDDGAAWNLPETPADLAPPPAAQPSAGAPRPAYSNPYARPVEEPLPAALPPPRDLVPVPQPTEARTGGGGQLVENIPRVMRVGVPVTVEVRLVRNEPMAAAGPLAARALTVRLTSAGGGFVVTTEAPETSWIEAGAPGQSQTIARWRWVVIPQLKGRRKLQLAVSTRWAGPEGLSPDIPMPEQVIDVRVKRHWGRVLGRFMRRLTWLALGAGLALAGTAAVKLVPVKFLPAALRPWLGH